MSRTQPGWRCEQLQKELAGSPSYGLLPPFEADHEVENGRPSTCCKRVACHIAQSP